MKHKTVLTLGILLASYSHLASAQMISLQGSDTLRPAMVLAIKQAGLEGSISYAGGGSGLGEAALLKETQKIAPMSRRFADSAYATVKSRGVEVHEHIIGLDGVGIRVNDSNRLTALDIPTLRKIYNCEITHWNEVSANGDATVIKPLRRDDESGTTDTFKNLVGIKNFGACVQVFATPEAMLQNLASDNAAVGYLGVTGTVNNVKALAISRDANSPAYLPSMETIQNASYPLSRNLYIYEDARVQNTDSAEKILLNKILDRTFMDPIMVSAGFFPVNTVSPW